MIELILILGSKNYSFTINDKFNCRSVSESFLKLMELDNLRTNAIETMVTSKTFLLQLQWNIIWTLIHKLPTLVEVVCKVVLFPLYCNVIVSPGKMKGKMKDLDLTTLLRSQILIIYWTLIENTTGFNQFELCVNTLLQYIWCMIDIQCKKLI